jgi:hypothetical protein
MPQSWLVPSAPRQNLAAADFSPLRGAGALAVALGAALGDAEGLAAALELEEVGALSPPSLLHALAPARRSKRVGIMMGRMVPFVRQARVVPPRGVRDPLRGSQRRS